MKTKKYRYFIKKFIKTSKECGFDPIDWMFVYAGNYKNKHKVDIRQLVSYEVLLKNKCNNKKVLFDISFRKYLRPSFQHKGKHSWEVFICEYAYALVDPFTCDGYSNLFSLTEDVFTTKKAQIEKYLNKCSEEHSTPGEIDNYNYI